MPLALLDVELVMLGADEVKKGLAGVNVEAVVTDKSLEKVKSDAEGAGRGLKSIKGGADDASKGLESVSGKSDKASKGMAGVKGGADGAGKGLGGLTKICGAAGAAFSTITGYLMGFVRAGLAGTVQGAVLEYRMQMLSREIATVFLPTINKAIDYLQQGVIWFRSLSQETKDSYREWVQYGVALLGVVAVLPRLVQGFGLLKLAVTTWTGALTAGIIVLAAFGKEIYDTEKKIDEIQKKMNRVKNVGLTESEFGKSGKATLELAEGATPEEKERLIKIQREAMVRDMAELNRQKQNRKTEYGLIDPDNFLSGKTKGGRDKDILQAIGKTALGGLARIGSKLFGGGYGNDADRLANIAELERNIKRSKMALDSLTSGKKPKFAPDEEDKGKDRLDLKPLHGFQSFADKGRTAQLAALQSESPERATARNTKEIDTKLAFIASKVATALAPIVR